LKNKAKLPSFTGRQREEPKIIKKDAVVLDFLKREATVLMKGKARKHKI